MLGKPQNTQSKLLKDPAQARKWLELNKHPDIDVKKLPSFMVIRDKLEKNDYTSYEKLAEDLGVPLNPDRVAQKRSSDVIEPGAKVLVPLRFGNSVFEVKEIGSHIVLKNLHSDETQVLDIANGWMLIDAANQGLNIINEVDAYNRLLTNEWLRDEFHEDPIIEGSRRKTPTFLLQQAERDMRRKGKTLSPIEASQVNFSSTARIDTIGTLTDTGLNIDIIITCSPKYMCQRMNPGQKDRSLWEVKDLVMIMLERSTDDFVDCITVIEPTQTQNRFRFTVGYSYELLANLFNLEVNLKNPTPTQLRELVIIQCQEIGVKAQWYAEKGEGANGQNHTSGGVFQKGGSGLIKLQPITIEKLLATEDKQRNTEWNMGERLNPGRPIFDKFSALLQLNKEMATTLEAESEFLVPKDKFQIVVGCMNALTHNPFYWKHFGIKKMEGEVKVYRDTYYDIIADKPEFSYALLKNKIVLRRRSVLAEDNEKGVKVDPADTFLVCVKGESYGQGERIRLAAQVNMVEAVMNSLEGMSALKAFICDLDSADNAFCRVLNDALRAKMGFALNDLSTKCEWRLKPVMRLMSARHKFSMELQNGTVIDFSADDATGIALDLKTGELTQRSSTIYSFEFGVGHPGLTATDTASLGNSSSVSTMIDMFEKKKTITVTRPYHITKDLKNDKLFAKSDFQQYQTLRNAIILEAFGFDIKDLEPGGNKAYVIAKNLGMIKD